MFVWVLFLFAGLLALLLLLLGSACRFRATLQLEPAGGHLELQAGYLLLSQRFRFRVSLLSAPYLTVEWLRTQRTYPFIDTFEQGVPFRELIERRRQALLCDLFLTGANAVTLDGIAPK